MAAHLPPGLLLLLSAPPHVTHGLVSVAACRGRACNKPCWLAVDHITIAASCSTSSVPQLRADLLTETVVK
jgi:hypothetical protein